MKKKTKKRRNLFPVIGKYIDTPTKAELEVTYFVDNVGDYKLSNTTFPETILKSCRFQIKGSQLKKKKKFNRLLQKYIYNSIAQELEGITQTNLPLLFGLLKLRKGKTRKLILIAGADTYYKMKTVNVIAVNLDNLLYMDLVNRFKNGA